MIVNRKLICIFLGLACLIPVFSDTFRVRKTEVVTIEADSPVQTIGLGYNDALAVMFTENTPFLRGIELECSIPKIMLTYRNSVAYSLYSGIIPAPFAGEIDYKGKQIYFEIMPARVSFVLQIPVIKNSGMKSSPYASVLPEILNSPVFFRFQPVMKGLPESIEEVEFTVEVKPVLTDEGLFELILEYPDVIHQPVTVTIDEKTMSDIAEPVILAPGMHHLSVVSEHYRNEVRVFNVEQAKTAKIEIELQNINPTMTFLAPNDAQIYLNDQALDTVRKIFLVKPGLNTVKFIVGDYEIKKTIEVLPGKSYTVSLVIGIQIAENQ